MPDLDYAVGVCGFGRCGSTMTMQMLVAGGLPAGNASEPPYEGDREAIVGKDFTGTCVKLLDEYVTAAAVAGPTRAWRFIWLDRDPYEQGCSYLKFLNWMAPATGISGAGYTPQQVANTYGRDRPGRIAQLNATGTLLVLDYERVLLRPRKAAARIRRDIFPHLDVAAAAAQVHQRDGRCLPDLAVEESFHTPARSPHHPPARSPS